MISILYYIYSIYPTLYYLSIYPSHPPYRLLLLNLQAPVEKVKRRSGPRERPRKRPITPSPWTRLPTTNSWKKSPPTNSSPSVSSSIVSVLMDRLLVALWSNWRVRELLRRLAIMLLVPFTPVPLLKKSRLPKAIVGRRGWVCLSSVHMYYYYYYKTYIYTPSLSHSLTPIYTLKRQNE